MNMPETALQTTKTVEMQTPPQAQFSAFGNIIHFESAQRMAKALCSSAMVPQTYQGEQNIGSCLIALEMSNRIGANVLSVMQNLYIVHGKPAWSSQFLIACVNASGRFSPLRYRMTGDKSNDTFGCVAWATDKTGEKLESPEITIGTAKSEGWFQKNGSKWKTMPELMLRYRCATLFARLYAPELTMGIQTDDEVIDVVEVAPVVTSPVFVPAQIEAPKKEKPAKQAPAKPTPPEPKPVEAEVVPPAEPERDDLTFEQVVDGDSPELTALRATMTAKGATEAQVLAFCAAKGNCFKPDTAGDKLADLLPGKVTALTSNINAAGQMLKQIKGEA
jgi:cell division septation protein DedD